MDNIDLDAILEKHERTYDRNHAKIKGSQDYNFRAAMREAINQALVLASEQASLERYFPDEGFDINASLPDEDNYEASYKSPYKEDSGCTIWIDKQSILDIEKLVV